MLKARKSSRRLIRTWNLFLHRWKDLFRLEILHDLFIETSAAPHPNKGFIVQAQLNNFIIAMSWNIVANSSTIYSFKNSSYYNFIKMQNHKLEQRYISISLQWLMFDVLFIRYKRDMRCQNRSMYNDFNLIMLYMWTFQFDDSECVTRCRDFKCSWIALT